MTRFNVRVDARQVALQSPEWLERRFELFARYCAPSVATQTEPDFAWLILCDEGTSLETVERLCAFDPRIRIALMRNAVDPGAGGTGPSPEVLRHPRLSPAPGSVAGSFVIAPHLPDGVDVVVTTRLDSDDALSRHAIERVRGHLPAFLASGFPRWVLNPALGYRLDRETGQLYESGQDSNPFLSMFERVAAVDRAIGALSGKHSEKRELHPTCQDDRSRGWIQVIHGGNVLNRIRPDERPVPIEELGSDFAVPEAVWAPWMQRGSRDADGFSPPTLNDPEPACGDRGPENEEGPQDRAGMDVPGSDPDGLGSSRGASATAGAAEVPTLLVATRFGLGVKDRQWLEHRLRTMEAVTAPSLASQSRQDFVWAVFVDPDLDPAIRAELERIVARSGQAMVVDEPHASETLLALARRLGLVRGGHVLTGIVDDDDAWHRETVERVHERFGQWLARPAAERPPAAVLTFASGLEWLMHEMVDVLESAGKAPTVRQPALIPLRYPFIGMSIFLIADETVDVTPIHRNHLQMEPLLRELGAEVIVDERPDMWVYTRHKQATSILQHVRQATGDGRAPDLAELEERFGIDAERVAAYLADAGRYDYVVEKRANHRRSEVTRALEELERSLAHDRLSDDERSDMAARRRRHLDELDRITHRLVGELEDRSPRPWMSSGERGLLMGAADVGVRTALEFGSGASTLKLLDTSLERLVSMEADPQWSAMLRRQEAVVSALADGRLTLLRADIGATGRGGKPLSEADRDRWPGYWRDIWSAVDPEDVDLVFVDGRFRVACVLNALLEGPSTMRILVHDYASREHYSVVERHLDLVERVEGMAMFVPRSDRDAEALRTDLDRYAHDWR